MTDQAERLAAAIQAEIRETGIFCPACETNLDDLPDDHRLTWRLDEPGLTAVECNQAADTARVLETPAHCRDAMIIHVYEHATAQALGDSSHKPAEDGSSGIHHYKVTAIHKQPPWWRRLLRRRP